MFKRANKGSFIGKFVENTWWMMARNIYSMLISLVVGSLSARFLGPSNYGVLNYGASIVAFFTTVSQLGMDSIIVAEMVRKPDKEDIYLGTALMMRLLTSVISVLFVWGMVVVLEPNNQLVQIVTVLQAISIIFQSLEVLYYWFQAHFLMKYVTYASMVALTTTGIWRILLLVNRATVEWFAMSAAVSSFVCSITIVFFFFKNARISLKVSLYEAKYLFSNSYHFLINGLAVTLYTQLDRIMLAKIVGEEAVGLYSAASTVALMWGFVPLAMINSASPILVKLYEENRKEFVIQYKLLLLGISVMGILVSLVFTVFGKVIIHILYGEIYYAAIPALLILIWSTTFSMIGSARGVWLVAASKNKYVKYFTLIGAVVNAVLNVIVIPKWGIIGASVTTLASQIIVSIIAPFFFKETKSFCKMYFSSFKELPDVIYFCRKFIKG